MQNKTIKKKICVSGDPHNSNQCCSRVNCIPLPFQDNLVSLLKIKEEQTGGAIISKGSEIACSRPRDRDPLRFVGKPLTPSPLPCSKYQ